MIECDGEIRITSDELKMFLLILNRDWNRRRLRLNTSFRFSISSVYIQLNSVYLFFNLSIIVFGDRFERRMKIVIRNRVIVLLCVLFILLFALDCILSSCNNTFYVYCIRFYRQASRDVYTTFEIVLLEEYKMFVKIEEKWFGLFTCIYLY